MTLVQITLSLDVIECAYDPWLLLLTARNTAGPNHDLEYVGHRWLFGGGAIVAVFEMVPRMAP